MSKEQKTFERAMLEYIVEQLTTLLEQYDHLKTANESTGSWSEHIFRLYKKKAEDEGWFALGGFTVNGGNIHFVLYGKKMTFQLADPHCFEHVNEFVLRTLKEFKVIPS